MHWTSDKCTMPDQNMHRWVVIGDPEKAMNKLGWKPETTLEQLCKMMVDADLVRNSVNASF